MHWHVIKQSWDRRSLARKRFDHAGTSIVILPGHCKVHGHSHRDAPAGHTHYGDLPSVRTLAQAEARSVAYSAAVAAARARRATARG